MVKYHLKEIKDWYNSRNSCLECQRNCQTFWGNLKTFFSDAIFLVMRADFQNQDFFLIHKNSKLILAITFIIAFLVQWLAFITAWQTFNSIYHSENKVEKTFQTGYSASCFRNCYWIGLSFMIKIVICFQKWHFDNLHVRFIINLNYFMLEVFN